MGQRAKPRILGVAGSLVGGAWQAYAYWTTASQLPSDAGWVAQMIADPPVYLPWLILVGFVLLTAWAFWPREDDPPAEANGPQITHGPNSSNFGSVAGNVNQHFYPVPPEAERKSGYTLENLDGLARALGLSGQDRPAQTSPWDDPNFSLSGGSTRATTSVVRPDMELREVLDRLYISLGGPTELIKDFEARIDLKIRDGVQHWGLHTWGRKNPKGALIEVWSSAWLRGDFSHKRGSVHYRDPDNPRALHAWGDLHFNREEVDKWLGPSYQMIIA